MAITQFPINTETPGQVPVTTVVASTDTLLGTFSGKTQQAPVSSVLAPVNSAIGSNTNSINVLAAEVVALQGQITNGAFSTILSPSGDVTGVIDTLALSAAYQKAIGTPVIAPNSSSFVGLGTITFNPGIYYINQAQAMMNLTSPTLKMSGLKFKGAGSDVTWIVYNPSTPGPLCANRLIGNLQFEGITFYGNSATSDFYQASEQGGLSNIQYFSFTDCSWGGAWQNIALASGANNCSEWKWDRCSVDSSLVANWLYIAMPAVCTITSGNPVLAMTNINGGFAAGQTCTFGTTVGSIVAGTTYFIVAATATGIQIATTFGGSALTPSANGTSTASNATDQLLNFWWTKCKFWDTKCPWINVGFGGHFNIDDCDVSNHQPTSPIYLFNMLGTPNANGVQQFNATNLRVEHATDFSLLMKSNWNSGNISFKGLDESSQVGSRSPADVTCVFTFVNQPGPIVTFKDSMLAGMHNYTFFNNNFAFKNEVLYEGVTLMQNNSAANFISTTNSNGNSGGVPLIRFKSCRNLNSTVTLGYHEVVDTDLFWNLNSSGQTDTKVISFVSANSDWPFNGGNFKIRLPLNAMITRIRYWNSLGTTTGAYNYSIQTTESTPTVLMSVTGANGATPVPVSAMVTATPNFIMASDAARTIEIIDLQTRAGTFTNMYCLIDYIG